jgi:hypothetical protein
MGLQFTFIRNNTLPLYEYNCPHQHIIEEVFSIGEAQTHIYCLEHETLCERYFSTSSVKFTQIDEFRSAYLNNTSKAHDVYAPKCKEDVKLVHKNTGRIYFGNDVSSVNMTSQMKKNWESKGTF